MAWQDKPLAVTAKRVGVAALVGLRTTGHVVATIVAPGGAILRLVLRRIFEVLFALVLLFEEWGWRPLAALLARLAKFPFFARLEAMIVKLPPYGALAAFVTPSLLILPLKLIALYLITAGHAVMAALLFIGAKIAGTAILARLFMLTQPKLMQISWFASAYNFLMPWKDRMFAAIRASWAWRYGRILKYRVGQAIKARWVEVRPRLMELRDRLIAQGRATITQIRAWWG